MFGAMAAAAVLAMTGSPPVAGAQTADWIITQATDPLSDKPATSAVIRTAEGEFQLACDLSLARKPLLLFSPRGAYLGDSFRRPRAVVYRFDEDPAIEDRSWSYTREAVAKIYGDPTPFVRRLATSRRLTFRAFSYRSESYTATFDVSGAGEAIGRVYAACGLAAPR